MAPPTRILPTNARRRSIGPWSLTRTSGASWRCYRVLALSALESCLVCVSWCDCVVVAIVFLSSSFSSSSTSNSSPSLRLFYSIYLSISSSPTFPLLLSLAHSLTPSSLWYSQQSVCLHAASRALAINFVADPSRRVPNVSSCASTKGGEPLEIRKRYVSCVPQGVVSAGERKRKKKRERTYAISLSFSCVCLVICYVPRV